MVDTDRREFIAAAAAGLMTARAASAGSKTNSAVAPLPASAIGADGTMAVPAFQLPSSTFLSSESREGFVRQARLWEGIFERTARLVEAGADIEAVRAAYDEALRPTLR